MTAHDQSVLFDLIHDAPFDPSLWVEVMDRLSHAAGGTTAVMTELDLISGAGTARQSQQDDKVLGDYFDYWATRNPLHLVTDPAAYIEGWAPSIIRDSDFLDRDVLRRSAYFNEFLSPLRAEQSIFIRLGLEGTVISAISVARPEARGPFETSEIDAARVYHRDMVRAVRTGRRVRLGQDALDDLDALLATTDQALIFLDRERRVRRISAAAEERLLAAGVLRLVDGRLEATTAGEDAPLQALIGRIVANLPVERPSIAVGAAGAGRFRLTAAPLGPRSLAATSGERFVLLTAVPEGRPAAAPTPELDLRQRFGLTAAESRVALAVADGLSLRQAAERLGVSIHTVRAQLGTVFGKTETRRQADLVRLLLSSDGAGGA